MRDDPALRVFPLGGLGEIGMNCLALVQDGEAVLVDCGVTFDDRGLGVDVVHPDFRALDELGVRVAGVVITHGHEDHIGALPYLLRRYDVPVWGPRYALALLRARADEHEVLRHARLHEVAPREVFEAGPFLVEPIRVTHSIADATALAFTTRAGTVVHTGDFKLDPTPVDGEDFDEARFRALGDAGVALLFSDSTNIDAPGEAGSEAAVGEVLDRLVGDAEGAVVVGLFASNVHRLRLLGETAKRHGRRLVPLGRSVVTHARVARATGYLRWPDDLVCAPEHARGLPRRAVLGVATGTQAEAAAALARLARGEHSALQIGAGDRVIFSSRVIPGHEPEVYALMGALLRRGAEVRSWVSDRGVHVSGHAKRDEQRRMLELVRPRAFVPVHGTLHHMTRHAALAREVGVAQTCVLEDGDVAALGPDGVVAKVGRIPVPRTFVAHGREVPRAVVRERQLLAEAGVIVALVDVGPRGELASPVRLVLRGVVDEGAARALVPDVDREVREALAAFPGAAAARAEELEDVLRLPVRRAIGRATGTKPLTVALVARRW